MKKNKLLSKLETSNIDNFTTNFGLKVRKIFHKPVSIVFKLVLRFVYKKRLIVDKRTKLDKNKNYIFALNHLFFFDGSSFIATNDRNSYALFGATEQLYFDFHTIFIWISGLIYVNRFDKQSRIDSVPKMNRVLKAGNSMLIFPEGRWNDSENLLCQKLFAGPYNLSVENKIEVVPVSIYNETYGNKVYLSYGKPLKLYKYEKDEALQILRDNMATMYYNQIMKYSEKFKREEIDGDIHFNHMRDRMYEYSKAKWRSDYCWDDELFVYKGKDIDLDDVWKDIDKVKINSKNAYIFKDILVELERRKKYNFTNYMNENYRKNY